MYAPRVFVSMIGVLVVFAIGTYALTGSIAGTLVQTLICAVLLQVGYFIGVVYLVGKTSRQETPAIASEDPGKKEPENKAAAVSRLNTPGHPNL